MSKLQENVMQNSQERDFFFGPVATHVVDVDTGSWRILTPVVDDEACTRCQICKKHCPLAIVTVDKAQSFAVDLRFCKGCGICAQVCPRGCIKMTELCGEGK